MSEEPRFLAALHGRNRSGRPPIWMMRQAGRTLASYRALRDGIPFVDFCKDVERAAEATLIPIRELGVDAAILFADIMLPVEALGLKLTFEEKIGPVVEPAIRDAAVFDSLARGDIRHHCGYLADIIRRINEQLPPEVPLIGFAPSAWTLAAYAVEGRSRKGFPGLKRFLYEDPEGFGRLLDGLTDLLNDYSRMQVEAGVKAFQVFDTWAELLPPAVFREVVQPRVQRQLDAVADVPRIYFAKGTAQFVTDLASMDVEGLGCDWSVDLPAMRQAVPGKALQGNLDPTLLYASPAVIRDAVHRQLDEMAGDPAYIFNLGHGLAPDIPEAHVHAVADAIRSWRA